MPLPTGASAREAQEKSGLDELQWPRFYTITLEVAKQFAGRSWAKTPGGDRETIRKRVNERLQEEKIPAVADDILRWRMQYALRDANKSASRPKPQAERATSADASRTSRPYDPVRDQ
ncbi:uncharacterized protein EI97DRAFT_406494 [Westerdykella ornata]|uniref:Uncharacterized protein n=1 Tax=Westerdykella ornata TaxID=318751 RepID=A0A6A6J7T5_WESOR|nr:uncharacterized protein EI97DRAFT_406494 [Westerdykella ornata]KAF2272264.1 hypothetical protein EI97DRAFT_406494 [Westerdykella ornata]